eukprot:12623906-Ditylum_brightwellii.AAC.1
MDRHCKYRVCEDASLIVSNEGTPLMFFVMSDGIKWRLQRRYVEAIWDFYDFAIHFESSCAFAKD